jgi:hypothetical protein
VASILESEFEISAAYFDVVSALDRLGCCDPDDLASDLDIRVDSALYQLGEGGLRGHCRVVRHVTPGARRHVALTPKGHDLATRADMTVKRETEALCEAVSPETLRMSMVTIRRLRSTVMHVLV